jgi:hypothetical protein
MKYYAGQVVMLLDTEFKPAGSAVICSYEQDSRKYEVDFIYPDKQRADKISVPEERLILAQDFPQFLIKC